MPRGEHHRRHPALPRVGPGLPPPAAGDFPPGVEAGEAVVTVSIELGESEPYDREFEQWLSEQAPITDDPMGGAMSRAWVAPAHRH